MPKARRHKKGPAKRSTQSAPPSPIQNSSTKPGITPGNSLFLSPGVRGPQSLIIPGMVALGCWGMAFSFLVLTTESNHILFGGMAVLMALLWTFSFGMRLRKLLLLRQRS
ncbi:MAG: hypothetical protein E6J44_07225 [Chloroflexi bacterium]|nr:MAG: hypothetical protein E6J44_07225 [Chloroflexota bacterium]